LVQATIEKVGNKLTVTYVPEPNILLGIDSYGGLPLQGSGRQCGYLALTFTVFKYSGPTKDTVKSYPGLIRGSAVYTAILAVTLATLGTMV
jgi:hypothetical protein